MEPATAADSILQATLSPDFAGWGIVQNLGMRSLLGRIDALCKATRKLKAPPKPEPGGAFLTDL